MSPLRLALGIVLACISGHAGGQSSFDTTSNYVAEIYTIHNRIPFPRGIVIDERGDALVVSNTSVIVAIYEKEGQVVTVPIVDRPELRLNHGITFDSSYLYASSSSAVYRWPYTPGQRALITEEPEVVVQKIPTGGDHLTRTLIMDRNFLYVSIGSANNVETDSTRSQIIRFPIVEGPPFDFNSDGELFAYGLRNMVGLGFDNSGFLWGVDCGADNLVREDLGRDIGNANPADELIRFGYNDVGAFYGYPYCWTVGDLEHHRTGEQLSWPNFGETDDWCGNVSNSRPATLPLPAHFAPLGITFYDGANCTLRSAFPCKMRGDAFIAYHGSVNRNPPGGYKVIRVPVDSATGVIRFGEAEDVIFEANVGSCGTRCFRPVGLAFDQSGNLIVTADGTSETIRVKYRSTSVITVPPPQSTSIDPPITSIKPNATQPTTTTESQPSSTQSASIAQSPSLISTVLGLLVLTVMRR